MFDIYIHMTYTHTIYRTSHSAAEVLVTPTVYSFVSFMYLMTFLAAQYCIGVTGSVYFHDITVVHGAAAPFFYKVLYTLVLQLCIHIKCHTTVFVRLL
jgi:hypothetical protein